jgi:hypothetical protein
VSECEDLPSPPPTPKNKSLGATPLHRRQALHITTDPGSQRTSGWHCTSVTPSGRRIAAALLLVMLIVQSCGKGRVPITRLDGFRQQWSLPQSLSVPVHRAHGPWCSIKESARTLSSQQQQWSLPQSLSVYVHRDHQGESACLAVAVTSATTDPRGGSSTRARTTSTLIHKGMLIGLGHQP